MIDPYKRRQSDLSIYDLFPDRMDGKCACGCEMDLPKGRKRWASKKCKSLAYTHHSIVFGDVQVIRMELRKRDHDICAHCGEVAANWEADHIKPVAMGGGGCGLDNFQTLCLECHKAKTSEFLSNRVRQHLPTMTEYFCM